MEDDQHGTVEMLNRTSLKNGTFEISDPNVGTDVLEQPKCWSRGLLLRSMLVSPLVPWRILLFEIPRGRRTTCTKNFGTLQGIFSAAKIGEGPVMGIPL